MCSCVVGKVVIGQHDCIVANLQPDNSSEERGTLATKLEAGSALQRGVLMCTVLYVHSN
jgi:hypothetical protein